MQRFWDKVDKDGDCWNWSAGLRGKSGYGCFKLNGKVYDSHRMAWVLTYGLIPEGVLVLHRCDNRKCVNPKHLYLGSYKDNTRDAMVRNRHCLPIAKTKLTEDQVREIRAKYIENVYGYSKLGREYQIHRKTVMEVIQRKIWKHI